MSCCHIGPTMYCRVETETHFWIKAGKNLNDSGWSVIKKNKLAPSGLSQGSIPDQFCRWTDLSVPWLYSWKFVNFTKKENFWNEVLIQLEAWTRLYVKLFDELDTNSTTIFYVFLENSSFFSKTALNSEREHYSLWLGVQASLYTIEKQKTFYPLNR